MKFAKNIIILTLIVLNLFNLTACKNNLGGISITNFNTIINNTTFDTKNLKLNNGDLKGDINYCIKVSGNTSEVSDEVWNKWFGNEKWDINGKIIVCLKLEYNSDVANDKNATITLPKSTDNKDETKLYKISEISDGKNFIYLILNPRHDLLHININYTKNSENKDIKYLIDLMDVNAEIDSALE